MEDAEALASDQSLAEYDTSLHIPYERQWKSYKFIDF